MTSSRPPARSGRLVAAAIGAVVALTALIAVVSTREADAPSTVSQSQPVTITGSPLPSFTDGTDAAIGQVAPTIEGKSFDGDTVSIVPGRSTLIVFLAHWCPHCQREIPLLAKWVADQQVPEGLDVIGVSTAVSADRPNYPPSTWLDREGVTFPVLADDAESAAGEAMGLASFPYFVLLDGTGAVRLRLSGEIDPVDLTNAITEALSS